MIGVVYLTSLSLGIACMLLLDFRYKLFFWHDFRSAAIVTVVGVAVMLAWDVAGILLGIFIRGEGEIATGLLFAPEMPIEEPIFLIFLVLCTMILYTGIARIAELRRERKSS